MKKMKTMTEPQVQVRGKRGMRKLVIAVLLALSMAAVTACSSKEEKVDVEAMAGELAEKVSFEDELNLTDTETGEKLYGIDGAEKSFVYVSSGATAEEIGVFEFESTKDAKEGAKKVQDRIAQQKEDFGSYIPKEVKRLDNAVIRQSGCYVVVCVSDDREAEKIISQYMK